MNPAHIHLMVNHVPLFAALFGGALLAYGLLKNERSLKSAGLILGVIAGLGGVAAVQSGERAEDIVEEYAGTNEAALEEHEEAAETTQWATILLGLASLTALLIPEGRVTLRTRTEWLSIALFAVTLAMVARTANLGGPIRHPEISSSGAVDMERAQALPTTGGARPSVIGRSSTTPIGA